MRIIILGKKQGVYRYIAGDFKSFLLAQSDELNVLFGCDAHNMHVAAVQTGEEQNGCQIRRLGICDHGLVGRPRGEVRSHRCNTVNISRGVVKRNK